MIILRNKKFTANLPAVIPSSTSAVVPSTSAVVPSTSAVVPSTSAVVPSTSAAVKSGFKLGTAGKIGLAGAATLGTLYMGKKLLGNKKKEENNYAGA